MDTGNSGATGDGCSSIEERGTNSGRDATTVALVYGLSLPSFSHSTHCHVVECLPDFRQYSHQSIVVLPRA